MNNLIESEKHIKVLRREYLLQQAEFEKILNKEFSKLREEGELYFVQYVGFDKVRGNVILKFTLKKPIPRKGEELMVFIPDNSHNSPPKCNGLKYGEIFNKAQRSTSIRPIWFDQTDDDMILIGFGGSTQEFLADLPANSPMILGPAAPPTDYLLNLIYLLENKALYPRFKETVELELSRKKWEPELLENNNDTSLILSANLQLNRDMVIQGPPGTGKSYLIAKICDIFLKQNKKVLVTALTNKALTEIIEKEGLETHLKNGNIFKSSLSVDEQKKYKKLKNASDYSYNFGTLMLSSFYHLSDLAKKSSGAVFDLVIVEEGSQAFLSTIGAARHLSERFILIGDQNQLAPVRIISNQDLEHPNLQMAFEGFSTFGSYFDNANKYILNHSFRLKDFSIILTNVFYDDLLISAENDKGHANFPDKFEREKSVVYIPIEMPIGVKAPQDAIKCLIEDLKLFYAKNPKNSFAILSFYKSTVKTLQASIIKELGFKDNILVDTIDRVQGLTVDYCFFLIPNNGLAFSLDAKRFNVATTRAIHFTGIYGPNKLVLDNLNQNVKAYFQKLQNSNL
jgi:DNA replication ATP-dependent helicase Dna2